jgi:hypothetical protein
LCAAIGPVPEHGPAALKVRIVQNTACRGPKVLLGDVSGRCYREAKPMVNPAKFGASGELCINDSGSDPKCPQ